MHDMAHRRAERIAAWCAVLVAAWPIGTLYFVFASRLAFPYDLEWCAGGSLYHAQRLLDGLPLYGGTEAVFQPFPYPPGYYAIVAGLGAITGLDYWTARFVSIAFFTAIVVVLVREVALHTGL